MQRYVLGFMFSRQRNNVLLIEKKRPDWQAGKWNGVGGKIEDNEAPFEAMCREFLEETRYYHSDWKLRCKLSSDSFEVFVFSSFSAPWAAKTVTDEKVGVFNVKKLPKVIPNLHWIIPMLLDDEVLASFATFRN